MLFGLVAPCVAFGFVTNDELKAQLKNPIAGGKRVSAAPTFSINDGAYVFSGAQETARWKLILEHFAADDDDA